MFRIVTIVENNQSTLKYYNQSLTIITWIDLSRARLYFLHVVAFVFKMSHQDWTTVVINKPQKKTTGAAKERDINIARRKGEQVDTVKKCKSMIVCNMISLVFPLPLKGN